ncbi:add-1 (predicted) [Pycnogonum litorale]
MGVGRSTVHSMTSDVKKLHVAVMKNDIEMVHWLVVKRVDVDAPWMSGHDYLTVKDGSTPLCEAVSLNHRVVTEVLIQSGASINKSDGFGSTPLHKAAYHGRHAVTEVLLAAGAEVNLKDHGLNSPLHICVQNALVHGSADTVRALCRAGARVNNRNKFGKIPLHFAALWGLTEIIEILIKAHSEIDHTDLNWRTPLYSCVSAMYSVKNKRENFVHQLLAIKKMLDAGCDSLNLITWVRSNDIVNCSYCKLCDLSWLNYDQPESLKHLCRVAIQRHFGFYDDNAAKIRAIPLPKSMVDYLSRKLLLTHQYPFKASV